MEELFTKNSEMLIKFDDFIIKKINWNSKSNNIIEISEELNIGIDSIIFIDDNPFECEQVKGALPEVDVYCLDGSNVENVMKVLDIKHIDFLNLTDEDKNKSENYYIEQIRNTIKSKINDVDVFLKSLQIELEVKEVNEETLERVTQLINKTNQFNLTNKRYSKTEIIDLIKSNYKIFTLNAKDKFGDYGLIGLAIVEIDKNIWKIDNFLLSCRVLKRKIEGNFMATIIDIAQIINVSLIEGYYVQSAKNIQVKDFLKP